MISIKRISYKWACRCLAVLSFFLLKNFDSQSKYKRSQLKSLSSLNFVNIRTIIYLTSRLKYFYIFRKQKPASIIKAESYLSSIILKHRSVCNWQDSFCSSLFLDICLVLLMLDNNHLVKNGCLSATCLQKTSWLTSTWLSWFARGVVFQLLQPILDPRPVGSSSKEPLVSWPRHGPKPPVVFVHLRRWRGWEVIFTIR